MNNYFSAIQMIQKHLLLVVDVVFGRFTWLNLNFITPIGVLYADGCGCDNCECKG